MAWFEGSAGVEEQGMFTGGPPGTWEPLSFPPTTEWCGKPRKTNPGPEGGATAEGSEHLAQGGTANQSQTRVAGGSAGSRSSS